MSLVNEKLLTTGKCFGLLIVGVCLAAGCAKRVAFTHDMRDKYQLGENELKQLQYFVTDTIRLRRVRAEKDYGVAGSRLQKSSERDVDEIVIKANTPGVVEKVGAHSLTISFEQGNTLTFGTDENNPMAWGGRYVFFADSWKSGHGEVTYDGRKYWATSPARYAHLSVNLEELKSATHYRRKVKGRKIE